VDISPTVLQAIDDARSRWENVPRSLRSLKRFLGVTDRQIAEAVNLSRQTVDTRLRGKTALTPWEVAGLSTFFEVPEEVLFAGPDASVRWVLDHPSPDRDLKIRNFSVGWARLDRLAVPA
jgi:hypothetical protein